MRKLIHRFFYAWLFLTRLPAPPLPKATKEDWGRIAPYFVLIGFILGFLLSLFALFIEKIHLPILLSSLMMVLMWELLTGGLHLDGLMDTFDGIGCTDPSRKIEAVRDSRVGAFGAMGGIFIVLFKLAALTTVLFNGLFFVVLFTLPVARLVAVYSLCFLKKNNNNPSRSSSFIAEGIKSPFDFLINLAVLILMLVWYLVFMVQGFVLWVIVLVSLGFFVNLIWAYMLGRHFQGHLGDTYGAVIELSEATFLVIAVIMKSNLI